MKLKDFKGTCLRSDWEWLPMKFRRAAGMIDITETLEEVTIT
ncbi:MAG: hypothetical protein ACLS5C_10110 [Waltera sp.]